MPHGPGAEPVQPGAGARPLELAGRATEVGDMDVALQRMLVGRTAKSQLVTGLRGVGKTVLLHEFGRVAVKRGFVHEHIEVHDGDQLPLQLAVALRKALLKLGGKKKTKGVNRRALGVLKAFTLALPGRRVPAERCRGRAGRRRLGRSGERPRRALRGGRAGGPGPRGGHLPHHRRNAPAPVGRPRCAPPRPAPDERDGPSLSPWPAPASPRWLRSARRPRAYAERMFRFHPIGALAPDECSRRPAGPGRGRGRELEGRPP